jgi:hypothetical protein
VRFEKSNALLGRPVAVGRSKRDGETGSVCNGKLGP